MFFLSYPPLGIGRESYLEKDLGDSSSLLLLLGEDLEILVDNGDGEKDSGSRSDSTHEVGDDGKSSNAQSSEGSGGWDVLVEGAVGGSLAMSNDDHSLLMELLGNVLGGRSGDLDPSLGEQSASSQDEGDVEDGVEWIRDDVEEGSGWRDIVGKSSDWDRVDLSAGSSKLLPASEKADQWVRWESSEEHLGQEVEVGDQGSLQDNWDVGGVEKLDWVRSGGSSLSLVLDRQVDAESLEVDDDEEDKSGSQQIGDVWQVLSVEGLLESADLVVSGDQEVDQGDESSLELGSSSSVDGGWAESLPDDAFADVGGDEQRDSRSQSVSLLEHFVEDHDEQSGEEELDDDEQGVSGSKVSHASVQSRKYIGRSLSDGDQNTKELLGSGEKLTIFLDSLIDLDNSGSSKKLHDETRSNDWTDSELHKRSSVGSEESSGPVEGIRRLARSDTVEWDLAADQEDEESQSGPDDLFSEWDLLLRGGDLWEEGHERLNQAQKAESS